VSLHWTGTVDIRVEGALDPLFEATARSAAAQHRAGESFAGRMLTATMALPHWGSRRRKPVLFDDIVKPELRTGTGERLQRRIYRAGNSDS
jgi:hypothetical protein